MEIANAIELLRTFVGDGLTSTISDIEQKFVGLGTGQISQLTNSINATNETMAAAAVIKLASAQINTTIHALGILNCLPKMLEKGETIEYVSLGAGNTNRRFDLETDRRVAEFKFIKWQGGAESIRQNSLFKDFSNLVEYQTKKRRQLCVLGDHHPREFFSRKRALKSVCGKNPELQKLIGDKHPDVTLVREYYQLHSELVEIVDVTNWVPELAGLPTITG